MPVPLHMFSAFGPPNQIAPVAIAYLKIITEYLTALGSTISSSVNAWLEKAAEYEKTAPTTGIKTILMLPCFNQGAIQITDINSNIIFFQYSLHKAFTLKHRNKTYVRSNSTANSRNKVYSMVRRNRNFIMIMVGGLFSISLKTLMIQSKF